MRELQGYVKTQISSKDWKTMKFKLPKIRKPTKLQQFEKQLSKKWNSVKKSTSRRFRFVGVWRNKASKWLSGQGQKIVAVSPPWLRRVGRVVWWPFAYVIRRINKFLARRPHRSFRLTRRRDYKRSFKMPGYWSFTNSVRAMLWKNWRVFGGLILTYFLLAFIFNSFGQQEAYQTLRDTLYDTGGDLFQGNWGKITGSGLILISSITNGLTPNATSAQTVLGGLTAFFAWLATVWTLRNIMAGRKVKVRDAIYSSGTPVISTILTSLVLLLQLLPISLAILIYNAAIGSELIVGVESMMALVAVGLLGVLSLYWITSTIIALVVVTLPGMYPIRAIQTAGDLVVGRRLRIVLRLVWLAIVVIVTWAIIVIPIILLDDWAKKVWPAIGGVPIVPCGILAMSSITIIFVATYIYMLYRKVVNDDAAPA
jgi:hypothetical protein